MRQKLNPELIEQTVALYRGGTTWNNMAAAIGVSIPTLRKALQIAGVPATRGQVNTRTSAEDESRIVELYSAGMPWSQIASVTGCSEHTISAVVKRNGGTLSRKMIRLPDDQRARIPDLYAGGMDAPDIGRLIGCSTGTIYTVLDEFGIDRRVRIPCGNADYFDAIDTPDKAYWLGFIAADGCVTGFDSGNPRLQVKLARKDRGHLEILHAALDANRPIIDNDQMSKGKMRPYSTLTVNSRYLAESLVKQGIIPRKTNTLEPWPGPDHLMSHYWRGLIDGDGSITVNSKGVYIGFTGSEAVVRAFLAYASDVCGTRSRAIQGTKGNMRYWTTQIGGVHMPRALVSALYRDAPTALARKRAVAESVMI